MFVCLLVWLVLGIKTSDSHMLNRDHCAVPQTLVSSSPVLFSLSSRAMSPAFLPGLLDLDRCCREASPPWLWLVSYCESHRTGVTRRSRKDFSIVHNVTSRQSLPDFHILIYKTEACRVFETDAGHNRSPKSSQGPCSTGTALIARQCIWTAWTMSLKGNSWRVTSIGLPGKQMVGPMRSPGGIP